MSLRLAVLPLCLLAALPLAAQTRGLDVRDLVSIDRVSSPVLSDDGRQLVFAQRSAEADGSKAETAIYTRNLVTRDMAPPRRVTPAGWNVNSPSLSPDGQTLYFLSAKNGSSQLYSMPLAGGTPRQLTDVAVDVGSYRLSPDGTRVALSADTFADCGADLACTRTRLAERKDAPASGVVYDQLFVRHWDTWRDGTRSRLFVADLPAARAAAVRTVRALGHALDGDIPSKPFGGADDYTWAPDGRSLVATVRIAGRTEPWSTNFDLYRIDAVGDTAPVNLTEANPATDTGPVFSADGGTLFYRAMKRAGFEADRYALMALDLASGQAREIAPRWDRSPSSIAPSADGRALYVAAQDTGQYPLFRVDIDDGTVTPLVGNGSVSSFTVKGDTVALTRNSLQTGDVLYTASLQQLGEAGEGEPPLRKITETAAERLPDVTFGAAEQFSFRGAGNATVYGYVVKPWNYQEGQTYPVAFLIHGGPQGSMANSWSYRWNAQTYAGQGYAVVMIDFHGSTGYGQAFTDAITGDWGGKPLEDLQKGWAAAQQRYAFLDGDRACALGASYGGYMVNWIAGNWFDRRGNAPFKCLVNHNGVFDTRSMGLVTEELWFTEWEFGGTVAENPRAYEKFNPARHIEKWVTPTLVVAGQNDFRVPIDQSLSSFTALQRKGVESKLLYFPDENHWVLKPANSILWHDTVNAWLRQHIGE
ncbi:S9 family peptidase [Luteimonas sp BLCC-B24]|uniref:dipeptidyl-peptidase 5 n=1 Tax=Luteimonas sp. BLCC-B24 TaxID=3025317 RepID=UPI00234CF8EA|nr:S9 family peptidase [Luteimonas sp. BLCC-B24]MDC7805912.1 S9 family peptidase [Luteimonas sp. BLCC-B24]